MKIYIYLIVIITAALSINSCSNAIDIYPVENNTADQFYSTDFEINQAVMGTYARLGRNGTNTDFPTDFYYQASESRSDNLYYGSLANAQRDQIDLRLFQVTNVTSLNTAIYGRLYQLIKDANNILDKAPVTYTRYRAEASFLRALAYFELVRAYGPQPVITTPVTSEQAKVLSRQPIADVYAQIITDLTFAGDSLSPVYSGMDAGRVGSLAAKCLLGYVYVTMAGYPLNDNTAYQKAETVLSSIMTAVKARFSPDYSYIFNVTKENTYDLFSVQFASGGNSLGSSLAGYVTSAGSTSTAFPEWAYNGYTQQGQDFRVDSVLVRKMKNAGDKRLTTSVATGYWTKAVHGTTKADSVLYYSTRNVIVKFLTKDNTNTTIKAWNDYPLNFPILRPADAYLLYAEALVNNGKVSDAKQWVDAIRTRAGLATLAANPTMDDIMYERRCEFLGEGKRYFDLVRMGETTFVSTLKSFSDAYGHVSMGGTSPTKKDMLLPIPLTVMNINTSWVQNPDY
ncbi:MAG TPA: RagB/SusD family nutrient uptake outer membrane protein [Paludibacter sp.]